MDAMALPPLVIGLVNSMPGEGRRHTEQQFRAILTAAARDVPVELRFFTLDPWAAGTLPDAAAPRYESIAALEAAPPDGLIVSGMAPRAAHFPDESYWPAMVRLIELARGAAVPTIWSCLAAHAAVFHLDGVVRQRFPRKLSGLVACARTRAAHPAMGGLPRRWLVPHSRYNDLPEAALRAAGYRILSRTAGAGADIFAKDDGAPFLFCQGHPEYDAATLLREYRRDIRQYLNGEREAYPDAPENYVTEATAALLDTFRARALRERRTGLMDEFPMAACLADLGHGWRDLAVGLYANWLADIAARKPRRPMDEGLTSARAVAWQPSGAGRPALGVGAE